METTIKEILDYLADRISHGIAKEIKSLISNDAKYINNPVIAVNNKEDKEIARFWASPDTAWFNQATIAKIRNCSEATLERDRWAGNGIPFIKCGRSVKYRKSDVIKWIESCKTLKSTSEY